MKKKRSLVRGALKNLLNFNKFLSTSNIKALAYFIELRQSFSLKIREKKVQAQMNIANYDVKHLKHTSVEHRPVALLYDKYQEPS